MMSPISLQSKRIATTALAPGARLVPHTQLRLVAAVGEQLGVADDFASRNCSWLRSQVAEVVACPYDQPEDVAVHFDDPVAGDLVGCHDEDGLCVLLKGGGRLLRRLESEPAAGDIGCEIGDRGGIGLVAAAEVGVGGMAPHAIPQFPAALCVPGQPVRALHRPVRDALARCDQRGGHHRQPVMLGGLGQEGLRHQSAVLLFQERLGLPFRDGEDPDVPRAAGVAGCSG
jgi:hypothetical protein